jgi:hypothetical protein
MIQKSLRSQMLTENLLWRLSDESGIRMDKLAESQRLFDLGREGLTYEQLLKWVKKEFQKKL